MSRLNRDETADLALDIGVPGSLQDESAALGVRCRRLTDIYGLAVLKLITRCLPLVARIVDGWDRLPARMLRRGAFEWNSGDNRLLIQRSASHDLTAIAAFAPDRTHDALVLLLETDGTMDTEALTAPEGIDTVRRIAVHTITFSPSSISGAIEAGARPDPIRELDQLFRRARSELFEHANPGLRYAIDLSYATAGRPAESEARALDRMNAVREFSIVDITPGQLDDLLVFLRWAPQHIERALS
jgi:hypothetical protein